MPDSKWFRTKYNEKVGQRNKVVELYKQAEEKSTELEQKYEDALVAQTLIHKAAKATQEQVKVNIENMHSSSTSPPSKAEYISFPSDRRIL